MFDIGFLEIVIIAAIALVVLGPERLPRAARTAGMWVGRARRMVADVKSDIDREIRESELADMRKLGDEMKNVTNEISQAADAVKNDDAMGDVVESIRESAKTLNQDVNEKTGTA
ncbi:MAG: Sec-independent protein translocase protein TatB [Gammaproteobacteria bacterium]|jgi:sec-independent protein translocase protein TatB